MAGYLDQYGVDDVKRIKRRKQIIFSVLIIAAVGISAYFFFQNFSEKRVMNHFLDLLKQKNYQAAYQLWETPESQKLYPPAKFVEDWGPAGIYKDSNALKFVNVDSCDGGSVFSMTYPQAEPFGLRVEGSTGIISYYPSTRCPGAHLQIMQFLKSHFGGG
jgi:hypothetical protein